MYLIGTDLSLYDPIVDWANHNWDFTFIKASEGTVPDPRFRAQWHYARGRIIRGPYHFFRPRVSVIDAADRFIDLLGSDQGELPPILDLEDPGDEDVAAKGLSWLAYVHKKTGRRPITYTALGFINSTGGMKAYRGYADYPLWLAEYPRDKIYPGWTEEQRREWIFEMIQTRQYLFRSIDGLGIPDFIQWTAKCPPDMVPGYPLGTKKAVDINFCRLTMPQLVQKYGINFIPREEEEVTDNTITLIAELGEFQPSNLRSGAGLTFPVRKTMTGPLTIKGVGKKIFKDGYYWIQTVEPYEGFVALTTAYGSSVQYNEAGLEETENPSPSRFVVRTRLYYNTGETQDLP